MNFFNLCVLGQVDSGKTSFIKTLLKELGIFNNNLDYLAIEQQRGITVKLKHTKIILQNQIINIFDTPGHAELVEEVIRAIHICSNIILIIDINKGIENHVINLIQYIKNKNLIVVFNKVDMSYEWKLDEVCQYLLQFNIKFFYFCISAKNGYNINSFIHNVNSFLVKEPEYEDDLYLIDVKYTNFGYESIIFANKSFSIKDEMYDKYKEKIKIFKVYNANDNITKFNKGVYTILLKKVSKKNKKDIETGTLNYKHKAIDLSIEQSPISSGLFCEEFDILSKAMKFMKSTYPKTQYHQINHDLLGNGYQIYATGSMEIEIIVERMQKEFNIEIISTPPFSILKYQNVLYTNPNDIKPNIDYEEQYVKGTIGFDLENKDKIIYFLKQFEYTLTENNITFLAPLSILDTAFYNTLQSYNKSKSHLTVINLGWYPTNIAIVDIAINKELTGIRFLFHKNDYIVRSSNIIDNISEYITLKNFKVQVSAIYQNRSFYSNTLSARKNNVAGKCYGGDYQRKQKLWKKQAEGRKKQSNSFILKGKELKNIIHSIYRKKAK